MSDQRRRIISTYIQAMSGKTKDSFRGRKVPKGNQVQRATQALRARKDLKVRQVPRESLVLRVILGTSALRVPQGILESKVR